MQKQLQLVQQFHAKFRVPVLEEPTLIHEDRSHLRYKLIRDEVEEYLGGVRDGDIENIAKELSDILYSVYGTILEHGLQEKIEAVFEEVHRSNMSKDYSEYKMAKGPGYFEADVSKIFQ